MKRTIIKVSMIMIISVIFMSINIAYAIMPPHPDLIKEWKEKGIFGKKMKELREASVRLLGPQGQLEYGSSEYGKYGREIARTGNLKALVVLVEFPEGNPLLHEPVSTVSYYEEMLFGTGKLNKGRVSFRDFYRENSRGKLDITGSVVGWYSAKRELSYYTNWAGGIGEGARTGELISECVDYAAGWFDDDLTQFDSNGDGYVDLFMVIHAGKGSEDRNNPRKDNFWSHFTSYFGKFAGGVEVWGYSINGEYAIAPQDYFPGVMTHECGHWFGLPDLYDYGGDSAGIGVWGMMGAGSWQLSSFTAWSKVYLGWVNEEDGTLINLCANTEDLQIPDIHRDDGKIIRLWTYCQESPEYFLVENRQRQDNGYDNGLPGSGLLIWHVDETVSPSLPNDNQDHPLLKLMQCDGRDDLYYGRSYGDPTDPWPCDNKAFDNYSNPSSRAYNGSETLVAIRNMSESGEIMTADFEVGILSEGITILGYTVDDIFGNADGLPNPGEEIYLKIKLINNSGFQKNVRATLMSTDPSVTIYKDIVSYGDMDIGGISEGDSSYHFVISAPEVMGGEETILFNLEITTDDTFKTETFSLQIRDPDSDTVFWDDFEGNLEERGWSSRQITDWTNEWHVSTQKNYTPGGSQSYKFGDRGRDGYLNKAYGQLTSPEIILPAQSILTFRYWIDAESLSESEAYDGGLVMILKDGKEELIEPEGGYPYEISLSGNNPLKYKDDDGNEYGYPCYSGRKGWSRAVFDLSQYEGQVQILFKFASDDFGSPTERGEYEGWYIDDISITSQKGTKREPPVIKMAGYYDTNISVSNGGILQIKAYVHDPNGYKDIDSVEVYYAGNPVQQLSEEAEGIYSFTTEVPPLDPGIFSSGMAIPLVIIAKDKDGMESVPWPYFRVVDVEATMPVSSSEPDDPYYHYQVRLSETLDRYMLRSYFSQSTDTPKIRAVGYLDSDLNNYGGMIKLIAQFDEDESNEISEVEVYAGDILMPFTLNNSGLEGDFVPGDSYFTYCYQFTGSLPPGDYTLDFVGVTKDGRRTQIAPYLILN